MLSGFIGISVLLIFIILLVMFRKRRNQNKATLLKAWAEGKGLNYGQTTRFLHMSPVISGEINNQSIHISEHVTSYNNSKKVFTDVTFGNAGLPVAFKIGKEGFLSRLGNIAGLRDIEFQNMQFDKTFRLKSNDEPAFRTLMNYRVQQQLSEIADDLKGYIISEKGVLSYRASQEMTGQERLDRMDRVIAFMLALQKST